MSLFAGEVCLILTVVYQNSVPRFETAWLKRARFPYTAKSSAKVIRHAVSIDERRAKFRQNLISQRKVTNPKKHHKKLYQEAHLTNGHAEKEDDASKPEQMQRSNTSDFKRFIPRRNALVPSQSRSVSRRGSTVSVNSQTAGQEMARQDDNDDEASEQDLQEIWYPGCHADIGGGWPVEPGLEAGLSHAPLLWMIREARKAGMPFNETALEDAGYILDDIEEDPDTVADPPEPVPEIRIDGAPSEKKRRDNVLTAGHDLLHIASTRGMIHDSLQFKRGTAGTGVIGWRIMEYLPFRRMDLKSDGTWAPIRWPLPFGEVRDIPEDAWIHSTALKRMHADEGYRPGNLIIGGGGRGTRVAPKRYGKGNWKVLRERGNPVGEVIIRVPKPEESKEGA